VTLHDWDILSIYWSEKEKSNKESLRMESLQSKLECFAEGKLKLSFEEAQELMHKCRQQRSIEREQSNQQFEARMNRIDKILQELSNA
jgi:hypothetical protein